jgi:hypothetical protein
MRRVTSVLKSVGLVEIPPVRSDDMEFYLNRGSMIHKAAALYDAGTLDMATVDPRITPYLEAWIKFRNEVGGEIVCSEYDVIHPILGYAGRLDRVIHGSALCRFSLLVDLKTTSAPSWAAVQTMAYALAYKRQTRTRKLARGAVALQDDGKWKYTPHTEDKLDEAAWRAALTLNAWLERKNKEKQ